MICLYVGQADSRGCCQLLALPDVLCWSVGSRWKLLMAAVPELITCCAVLCWAVLKETKEPSKDVFVDADDVVASIAAAPLLTTCRSHSKGCSCCISHGRGIADVGYSSPSCGSSAGSSRGSSSMSARPLHSRKGHVAPHPPSPKQQRESASSLSSSPSSSPQSRWYGCLYVACQSPYGFEAELPAITALSRMLTGG